MPDSPEAVGAVLSDLFRLHPGIASRLAQCGLRDLESLSTWLQVTNSLRRVNQRGVVPINWIAKLEGLTPVEETFIGFICAKADFNPDFLPNCLSWFPALHQEDNDILARLIRIPSYGS